MNFALFVRSGRNLASTWQESGRSSRRPFRRRGRDCDRSQKLPIKKERAYLVVARKTARQRTGIVTPWLSRMQVEAESGARTTLRTT